MYTANGAILLEIGYRKFCNKRGKRIRFERIVWKKHWTVLSNVIARMGYIRGNENMREYHFKEDQTSDKQFPRFYPRHTKTLRFPFPPVRSGRLFPYNDVNSKHGRLLFFFFFFFFFSYRIRLLPGTTRRGGRLGRRSRTHKINGS